MDFSNGIKMKLFLQMVESDKLLTERMNNKKRILDLRQDILCKLVISVVRSFQGTSFSLKFNDEVTVKCALVTEDQLTETDFDYKALGFTISYKEVAEFEFIPDVNRNDSVNYTLKRKGVDNKSYSPSTLSWVNDNNGGHWHFNTESKLLVSMPFATDAVTMLLSSLYQD